MWPVKRPSSGGQMVSASSLRETVAVLFGGVAGREGVLSGDVGRLATGSN